MIYQTLNQTQIAQRIPHAGLMCLLNSVEQWGESHIVVTAVSHRSADNPLRRDGQLASLHLIEYAAQAIAVLGSLLTPHRDLQTPKQGRLVSVRQVEWAVSDLTAIQPVLTIRCDLLLSDPQTSTFEFAVHADNLFIAKGRGSVMLLESGG